MGLFKSKELEQARAEISRLKNNCQILTTERNKLTAEVQRLKDRIAELEKQTVKSVEQNIKRIFNGLALTKEQETTFELLENTNKNYFVTGKAGTGKSTLLNYFRENTKKKGVAVVASTGAAALNVDGQTIHSLFRLDFEPQDTSNKSKVKPDGMVSDTLKAIDVLIIDEVSMVRADIMDMIDMRLRNAKQNNYPFGGCQVIAFGDLFQLPPIAADKIERDFITERYGTLFFFGAPGAKTFTTIELTTVIRQKEQSFVQYLNAIRDGRIDKSQIQLLNRQCNTSYPDDCLRIVLTRDTANKINTEKLSLIRNKEWIYKTELGGDNPPAKEDVPFDFELRLKVGAKVMMTNNDPAKKYVNGPVGKVTKLSADKIEVEIDKQRYVVEPVVWTKKVYRKVDGALQSEVVGWAKQYPIRLAYAITVHKSQGKTYDEIVIDFSDRKAFAAGQTYVALSRCRTLKGIHLTRPLTFQDIYADKEVLAYMGVEKPMLTQEEHKRPAWLEDADNLPF